jgi:hypothetical protein
MAPSIAPVSAHVEVPRLTKKITTPLKSTGSLDGFGKFDVTNVIGTEFREGIQVAELLTAPNSDDLIRDLAILGISPFFLSNPSLAKRSSIFPISGDHNETARTVGHSTWRIIRETSDLKVTHSSINSRIQ